MRVDLSEEFQQLWRSNDPKKRGHTFEKLFCRLLFKSGFEDIKRDPATARPRQTDLIATYGRETFLFEMKWKGRKIDIEAMGQIKDRLGRAAKGTIGCICSISGFTETLIKDVEACRSQYEILLFNPFEIYRIFSERLDIVNLIERKRRALKHDGIMWFYSEDQRDSKSRYVELPPAHESFEGARASLHMRLESEHISDLLFVRTPLIFNEYLWAFSLRLRLASARVDDLRELFFAAENYLGLQGTGTFSIRQREAGWYGLGSGNFLNEVSRYRQRYKGFKGAIHHSEELAFFDELQNGGIFLLTARQSMTREGQIHSGEVVVRLPGLPSDMELYNRFLRSVTTYNSLFTPERPIEGGHSRILPTIRIEPADVITLIRSKELRHDGISGAVVRNPFFGNPNKISKILKGDEALAFSEPEYLICRLDDWLDAGDEVDYLMLTGLDVVNLGEAVLMHPRCTWGNVTKHGRQQPRDSLESLGAEWNERERMVKRIKHASERRNLSPKR